MKGIFVTATGTEVGKTVVTHHVVRQLRAKAIPVEAVKPVVSGMAGTDWRQSDPARLLSAMDRPFDHAGFERVSPFRFDAPLAPDAAAAREGRRVDYPAIIEHVRFVARRGPVVVEGVGGVRVPLGGRWTVRDLIVELGLPAVVVSGSYLGSISHLLATLDSLAYASVPVAAVVVNQSAQEPMPLEETVEQMLPFVGGLPVFVLPRMANPFEPLSEPDFSEILAPYCDGRTEAQP